jgi:AraC-like DNA-binding protein
MRRKKPYEILPELRVGEFCLSIRTNPQTRVDIGYKERHPEYTSTDSGHDFWELLYVDRGRLNLFVDGRPVTISQDELAIILPHQAHGVGPSGAVAPFYVTAHFDTNLEALRSLGNTVLKVDEEGRRLLGRMLEEKVRGGFGSFELARCYLAEFLISAKRLQSGETFVPRLATYFQINIDDQIVKQATNYMASNLDKPISLQDVAEAVAVSRSHLEHMFKKHGARSVMSSLQELRIQKAKILLLESTLNVSEIAAECGYSSLHLFSRRFKKLVSICPSEYARMIRAALPTLGNRKQTMEQRARAQGARPQADSVGLH